MELKNIHIDEAPTQKQVEKFHLLKALFIGLFEELKELSKKKPNDPLNKLKVNKLNKVLEQLLEVLRGEPGIDFLETLDHDMIPSNSDGVFVMNQFLAIMELFAGRFYTTYPYEKYEKIWYTKEFIQEYLAEDDEE